MGGRPGVAPKPAPDSPGACDSGRVNHQLARIESLRWRYSIGDWVLRDIHLQLRPGERIGLVGRSGSGKSSLALTFNGIIPQSYAGQMGGEVVVASKNAATTPVAELAHNVAMVFQSPDDQMSQIMVCHEVASGPANLRFAPEEIWRRTRNALELLEISHLADRETTTLSGGEKQKVALAAALAMQPRLLVLDEPTTDLDPRSKSDLIAMLERIDSETAMVVVSHDLETIAPLVNRLVMLDDGAIVADADASELLAAPASLSARGVAPPQLSAFAAELQERFGVNVTGRTPTEIAELLRANGLIAVEPGLLAPPTPGSPVIELDDVCFRYPTAATSALDHVSLSIGAGELVAVVGNNGSGKTTLSKLILGLFKPTSGRVSVLDQPVDRIRPDCVGYIYQNPDAMLSQMSVRDEVAFTPKLLERAEWPVLTEHMLDRFGLVQLARRFPLALSKGQRQRVAYAAVAAASPPILIFDEPTTGIDQPGCDQIMEYMDALRREQKTIVFITHDMPLAMRWADRILVMHDGQLAHSGPTSSLTTLSGPQLTAYHLKLPPVAEVARHLGLSHVTGPSELLDSLRQPVSVCGT
jgi:energy-coupling factor transport system ATP-binding protein